MSFAQRTKGGLLAGLAVLALSPVAAQAELRPANLPGEICLVLSNGPFDANIAARLQRRGDFAQILATAENRCPELAGSLIGATASIPSGGAGNPSQGAMRPASLPGEICLVLANGPFNADVAASIQRRDDYAEILVEAETSCPELAGTLIGATASIPTRSAPDNATDGPNGAPVPPPVVTATPPAATPPAAPPPGEEEFVPDPEPDTPVVDEEAGFGPDPLLDDEEGGTVIFETAPAA